MRSTPCIWATQNFSTGNAAGFAAATQAALLDASKHPRLPYNLDSWDGYPAERERVLQSVKTLCDDAM